MAKTILSRHSRVQYSCHGKNSVSHSLAMNRQHSWVRKESEILIEQWQVIDAKEYYVGFLFINL